MKSLFEPTTLTEVIGRVQKISPSSQRQWGKMEVGQMLAHCGSALEMAMGTLKPKRIFIGRILGPILRSKYSDDKPFDHSSPTSDELKVVGQRDFNAEKNRLIDLINRFSSGGEAMTTKHPHPFFGLLTTKEWGIGMYKHIDHHLRQFSN
jgi:hypothetical protein